ncbi:hypothetical protein ANN_08448 [Periplaneta americana]|uniref:Uncharacterized protein n=1 Tax=Periplaneta americana TaxID=6978 RepID=A0ABQ8T1F8_PERAM|nr:hypothetical protein ANN_08448 [Periplaneta americana]
MAGFCEGGNEPPGSLKASKTGQQRLQNTSESAPNPAYAHCTGLFICLWYWLPTKLQSLPVKQYYCACSNGTVCRKCRAVNRENEWLIKVAVVSNHIQSYKVFGSNRIMSKIHFIELQKHFRKSSEILTHKDFNNIECPEIKYRFCRNGAFMVLQYNWRFSCKLHKITNTFHNSVSDVWQHHIPSPSTGNLMLRCNVDQGSFVMYAAVLARYTKDERRGTCHTLRYETTSLFLKSFRIHCLVIGADKNSIKHSTMSVLLFQTIAPGISLPPQPVLTRWKTWLDAANYYYAKYYGKIMELLEDILFIDSNFKIVSKSITLLESSNLQLSEALNIVDKVSQTIIQNNNSLIFRKSEILFQRIMYYDNDVNMLGENRQTIRENAEILVEASKAIGLEVNPEKTKYMIMSRDQSIVRNGTIKIGDLSFEEVEKFK